MRKAVLIFAVALILLLVAAALIRSSRAPRPTENDADLRPVRAEIPAHANGVSFLREAGQSLAVSGPNEATLAALGRGSSWDEIEAKRVLSANETPLTLLRQALSSPQFQVDAGTNVAQEFPYLREWRQLASLALIEARLSFHDGDELSAFKEAMDIVRFGHRVEESGGGTIHYLVGAAMKLQALECLRQLADTTRLPPDRLLSVVQQLEDFEANHDGLREALKVDYSTQADLFDKMSVDSSGQTIDVPSFVYSATRSKAELAEQIRLTMVAVTNRYAAGQKGIPRARTNVSTLRLLLRGNAAGTIVNEMSRSSRERLLAVKCRENVSVQATRAVLALRAFQMAQGRQPQSWEELIPDFLAAIPLDDFDGQPLRYSPNSKVVYSVGDNLADDGGVRSTNHWWSADVIFPFNF